MMSFMPVAVMKMSPILAASSIVITRKPSSVALSAAVGLISVTIDVGAHALGAQRDAAAAVAVAGDDEGLAGEQHRRGAQDAVERRLAGAVDVVEVPLGLGSR